MTSMTADPSRPADTQAQASGATTPPMTGAPEGASSIAAEAATFTARGASAQPQAVASAPPAAPIDTRQADAAARQAALGSPGSPGSASPLDVPPVAAAEGPLEDTRAVMYDPSRSEDHGMPGEAVPSSEPAAIEPARPGPEGVRDGAGRDGNADARPDEDVDRIARADEVVTHAGEDADRPAPARATARVLAADRERAHPPRGDESP